MENEKIIYESFPQRIDTFLASRLSLSRQFIKKMLKTSQVKVNGEIKKPSYTLTEGDVITIQPLKRENSISLKKIIIHENRDFTVISKPSGIAVHPNDSNWESSPDILPMCEETIASLLYAYAKENQDLPKLGIVHRLDRGTSGVMIIGKTARFCSYIKKQFELRHVKKEYLAVVRGKPRQGKGEIEAPIGRPPKSKKNKVWPYGRYALTKFEILESGINHTLLKIVPLTGRSNQIRAHLSYIGCPIMGDDIYGGPKAPRLMLHSLKISFPDPKTGRFLTFQSQLPADFQLVWKNAP